MKCGGESKDAHPRGLLGTGVTTLGSPAAWQQAPVHRGAAWGGFLSRLHPAVWLRVCVSPSLLASRISSGGQRSLP